MTDNNDELSMGQKRIATIAKCQAKADKSKLRMQKLRAHRKELAEFDLIAQQRMLVNPHETAPGVDATTPEEFVLASRRFAFALRWTGKDVPDIREKEPVSHFVTRVMSAWLLSVKTGELAMLLNARTGRFDEECGYRVAEETEETINADIQVIEARCPGLDKPIDITTLPYLGIERPAPVEAPVVKIWEEQGFDSLEEYQRYEAQQAADKLSKDAALASIDAEQTQYLKDDAAQQGIQKDTVLYKSRT